MSHPSRPSGDDHLWLIRPGLSQRIGVVVAGVVVAVCGIGVLASFAPGATSWWALPYFVCAGVLVSGARRLGALVRHGAVELHTVVSCTRVQLDTIERVHLGPFAAMIVIEHGDGSHFLGATGGQSEASIAAMRANVRDLCASLGVPLLEYSEGDGFGAKFRRARIAGLSAKGFLSVMRWPEVWCPLLASTGLLLIVGG